MSRTAFQLRIRQAVIAALGLFAISCGANGATSNPNRFSVGTGVDYSSGRYTDLVDTEILYVPFRFRYDYLNWTARLTVPWLQITGPNSVAGGGDSITVVNPGSRSTTRTTESGLGDVVGSLSYLFTLGGQLPDLQVTGKIKFPTADENKGLGTGSYDYTILGELSKTYGNFTPSASLGYKFKGDAPTVHLNDVLIAGAVANYRVNELWDVGATFDYQEATTSGIDDSASLGGYLNWKVHPQWVLTGYGSAGLTNGTADEEVGLTLRYKFYR